jgi:hypothetical protein
VRLLTTGRLVGAFGVTYRISGDLKTEGNGFVLNITISEPYQAGVSQTLSLHYRTVARPSQLRLCHKPRGPVLDPQIVSHYVTPFVFNCRPLLSEVRQQDLVLLRKGTRGGDSRSHSDV